MPNGRVETILQDADGAHVAWVEAAFQPVEMGRPHLDNVQSEYLRSISNLAFGGDDLDTAYLGCLLGDRIAVYDSPLAGRPLPHGSCDLGPLGQFIA